MPKIVKSKKIQIIDDDKMDKKKKVLKGGAGVADELKDEDADNIYNDGNDTENEAVEEVGDTAVEVLENLDEVDNEDALEETQEDDAGEDTKDAGTGEDDVGDLGDAGDYDEKPKKKANDEGEAKEDDNCFYRFGKNNEASDEEDDEFQEEEAFDDDTKVFNDIVKDEDRITKPVLTIYERVRLLGDRAKQLSLGAKPMIKNVDNLTPKDMAKFELINKVIPLIIHRPLPNGKREQWKINELEIVN